MSEVWVTRLRKSKVVCAEEAFNAGREAGQEWARETATYAELSRMPRIMASEETLGGMAAVVTGSDDPHHHDAFMIEAFGERINAPDEQEVLGFIDGAYDVWVFVETQLR